ncbi:uncharacterized protein LOC143907050 [Temnothorax americanus]|uniref:uncharacterized protein LOC143907050 n=1 Tax=Temnothorax americanus TaxID=1964332 RepID=UPI004068D973
MVNTLEQALQPISLVSCIFGFGVLRYPFDHPRAKKTKDIIHKLTNLICFTEAREKIFQFVLQISLRPLVFSGLRLFYFGYEFVCKFFVWILTVVVFMLQMKTSPISRIIIADKSNITCYN